MAWNGSYSAAKPQKVEKKAKTAAWRGIVAGFVVVAGAVVAVLFMMSGGEKPTQSQETSKPPKTISTPVPPPVAVKPTAEGKEAPETPKKPLPPQRVGELRDGYRLLPDGTLHRVLGIVTNSPPKMSLADKTFTHSADVELGNLLLVEPGDDLLGSPEGMYRGFGKELDEALEEPITYDKDDTDLQRELKDAVKEFREELVKRRAAGEDIEKVMEDTWKQLKELSLYRQDLEDPVRNLSSENMTQKDYEDLVKAANEMLADRGIKALEMPTTLKRTIRLRKIEEEAANRQKERNESNEAE